MPFKALRRAFFSASSAITSAYLYVIGKQSYGELGFGAAAGGNSPNITVAAPITKSPTFIYFNNAQPQVTSVSFNPGEKLNVFATGGSQTVPVATALYVSFTASANACLQVSLVSGAFPTTGATITGAVTGFSVTYPSGSTLLFGAQEPDLWTQLSLRFTTSMGIKADGTLWATGYNGYNQILSTSTNNVCVWTQLGTATNWATCAGGDEFLAALDASGNVWTVGDNGIAAQCHNGQGANSPNVTALYNTSTTSSVFHPRIITISTGGGQFTPYELLNVGGTTSPTWHGRALVHDTVNGILYYSNESGTLTAGQTIVGATSGVSVTVSNPAKSTPKWKNLYVGHRYVMVIDSAGYLFSWGNNGGDTECGRASNSQSYPSTYPQAPTPIVVTASGSSTAGTAYVNALGATLMVITLNWQNYATPPTSVTYNGVAMTQIAGTVTQCTADSSGSAVYYVANPTNGNVIFAISGGNPGAITWTYTGVTGNNTTSPIGASGGAAVSSAGTSVSVTLSGVVGSSSLLIGSEGTIYNNSAGGSVNSGWTAQGSPATAGYGEASLYVSSKPLTGTNTLTFTSTAAANLMLTAVEILPAYNGAPSYLYASGEADFCANPTQDVNCWPVHYPGSLPFPGKWVNVFPGAYNCFALSTDGKMYGWGKNAEGEMGAVQYGVAGTYPHVIPCPTSTGTGGTTVTHSWINADAGDYHCMLIRDDGALFGAGKNSSGQLGNNATTTPTDFVQVPNPVVGGVTGYWTQVSCGATHTLAIDNLGYLWGWGDNSAFQLGLAATGTMAANNQTAAASVSVPTLLDSSRRYTTISAGEFASLALSNSP